MSNSNDPWEKILGAIALVIIGSVVLVGLGLVAAAGVGAYGAYALASAAGAGKALAVAAGVAGLIAGPAVAAKTWDGIKNWKKHRREKQWKSERASRVTFNPPVVSAPAPQPAPKPVEQPKTEALTADDTPPIFVDAFAKMKELPADERKKYFDKLRDAFPNEVESLGDFNQQMALARETTPMKKLSLVKKQEPQA